VRRVSLLLGILPLLTACAVGRSAPPPLPVPCPIPPNLAAPAQHVLEQDFLDRMQNFLQGKLPEETKPGSPSSSATRSTKPSASN
jgi:hypothetical protein